MPPFLSMDLVMVLLHERAPGRFAPLISNNMLQTKYGFFTFSEGLREGEREAGQEKEMRR